MISAPSSGDRPRKGRAVMIRASSTAPTVLPTKVARPPDSAAPPSTAAVMLFRVNGAPIAGFPIGERAITKNEAIAAITPEMTRARTRIQLVLIPPRLADRSSKPTARTSSPDPEACSHRSSIAAPRTSTMKAIGIGPQLDFRNLTRSGLMTPCAVGRRVCEIPSRMLSVASVAINEGIFTPRIRTALTSPRPTPQARITPRPLKMPAVVASAPMRNDPTTTPKVIIAPTDRSKKPTRMAWVCAIAARASGMARIRIVVMLARLMNPSKRLFVYSSRATINSIWRATGIHSRTLTILRHLFLSRALRITLRPA